MLMYRPCHTSRRQTAHVRRRGAVGAIAVLSAVAGAGPLAVPSFAATHAPARRVAFSGHYTGKASLLIDNGAVTISSVKGAGRATLLGASTVTGKGTASATAQCDPFGGTGAIAARGSKIDFKVTSSNGESAPVVVSFHGTATAVGGTGRSAGARGSLSFRGTCTSGERAARRPARSPSR